MPDAFFTSPSNNRNRKRKRSESDTRGAGSKRIAGRDGKGAKRNTGVNDYSSEKRKAGLGGAKKPSSSTRETKGKKRDEELESDQSSSAGEDDDDRRQRDEEGDGSGDEDLEEDEGERRLRLAKVYLESVRRELGDGEYDAAEIDKEIISARLKRDVLEGEGKVFLFVADQYDFSSSTEPPAITPTLRLRGHRLSVTSAVSSDTAAFVFTAGKEGSIIKWDLTTGKKLNTFRKVRRTASSVKGKGKASKLVIENQEGGHTDEILALALSSDGQILASGGRDRRIGVWDAEKGEWIKGFDGYLGHRDSVSCLAFRQSSHTLFSGSLDRTVRVHDLSRSVMGYVETLFGHQDHVISVDALRGDTCVSVGGRDRTARFWKIVDETQLVFRGGGRSKVREVLEGGLGAADEGMDEGVMDAEERKKSTAKGEQYVEGSMDCAAMIDENTFITGGDSGSICLWTTQKKKPIFTQPLAHGFTETLSETEGLIKTPRWVTALASLKYSDLFASGSWDGTIRLWKLDSKLKSFSLVGSLPALGCVNSLQIVTPPKTFFETATWVPPSHGVRPMENSVTLNGKKATEVSHGHARTVLLVAGVGQEHRLGRWLTIKNSGDEPGATPVHNAALVFALHPRRTA